MLRNEPTLIINKDNNRTERVVDAVGRLKVGETAQVEVRHENYPVGLMRSLRLAYPRTVFKSEKFRYQNRRFMYIHIEDFKTLYHE